MTDSPMASAGAKEEWRKYWYLPLVAALGTAASVITFYSIGPFIEPLATEFGWSRAQISAGILVANGISAVFSVVVGLLIDRFGPRAVGVIGVVVMCTAFALIGLATGDLVNWYFHWVLVGIGSLTVQTPIWAAAVSSRFSASRGFAIAITMCGNGFAAAAMPLVAAVLLRELGWRYAFAGVGLFWAIIILPPLILFFRGAQDKGRGKGRGEGEPDQPSAQLTGYTLGEGLRRASFYKLALAGAIYSLVLVGTIVHFVPILVDRGTDPVEAAAIAGLVGIASIAGRLSTGLLLDRFRGDRVAPIAFLVPTVGLYLLATDGSGAAAGPISAIIIGFSIGAELDVIAYLATRYMGLRSFGSLFAAMLTGLGAGTALGPISAGATFDSAGSYTPFLLGGIPAMIFGAILLATLGRYPDFQSPSASGDQSA